MHVKDKDYAFSIYIVNPNYKRTYKFRTAHMSGSIILFTNTDAAPSSLAYFNDSRCTTGGVHFTDPLLYTCELHEVYILQVKLPTDYKEAVALGDTASTVSLPAGFTAVFLNVTVLYDFTRSISLTIILSNASLLDGGNIVCDDTTERNRAIVGCPIDSKLY